MQLWSHIRTQEAQSCIMEPRRGSLGSFTETVSVAAASNRNLKIKAAVLFL